MHICWRSHPPSPFGGILGNGRKDGRGAMAALQTRQPAAFRDAEWDRKLDNLLDDLEHSGGAPTQPTSSSTAVAIARGGGGGHHAQSGTTSVLSQQQSSSVSHSSYQQRSTQQTSQRAVSSSSSKFM